MGLEEVNTERHDALVASGATVLVEFGAPWCAPCKVLEPVLEKVAAERFVLAFKVNIDDEHELAKRLGIRSAPTTRVYKAGVCVDTIVGVTTKERLFQALER